MKTNCLDFHDNMMKRVYPAPTWHVVSDGLTGPAGVRKLKSDDDDEGFLIKVSTILGEMFSVCSLEFKGSAALRHTPALLEILFAPSVTCNVLIRLQTHFFNSFGL